MARGAKHQAATQKIASKIKASIPLLKTWHDVLARVDLEALEQPPRDEESAATMEALLAENRRLRSKHQQLTKTLSDAKKENNQTLESKLQFVESVKKVQKALSCASASNDVEMDILLVKLLVGCINGCCMLIQISFRGSTAEFDFAGGLKANLTHLEEVVTSKLMACSTASSLVATTDVVDEDLEHSE